MNRRLIAACRTARTLLQSGLLAKDFKTAFDESFPNLSEEDKRLVVSSVKKEVGVLGQTIHDPNLFASCNLAKKAKKAHPNKNTLIATYRTPMCGTCSYNRQGSCALMGGRLVNGLDSLTDNQVQKTASLLVEEGHLEGQEAERIAASSLHPSRRVAALHLSKLVRSRGDERDLEAQRDSRRIASQLENSSTVSIQAAPFTGYGQVRNREDWDEERLMEIRSGDEEVSRTASAFEKLLRPMPTRIPLPMEEKVVPRNVRLSSSAILNIPDEIPPDRYHSPEVLDVIQHDYDKLVSRSASLLSQGLMDINRATKYAQNLELLESHGAQPTRVASRILTQLKALRGDLEM